MHNKWRFNHKIERVFCVTYTRNTHTRNQNSVTEISRENDSVIEGRLFLVFVLLMRQKRERERESVWHRLMQMI